MSLRLLMSLYLAYKSTNICGNCLILHLAGDHISFCGSFQCPCTTDSLTNHSGTNLHLHLHISSAWIRGICHLIKLFRVLLIGSFLIDVSRTSSDLQATKHGRDRPLPRCLVAKEAPLRRDEALLPAPTHVGGHLLASLMLILDLDLHEACRLRHIVLLLDSGPLHDYTIRTYE